MSFPCETATLKDIYACVQKQGESRGTANNGFLWDESNVPPFRTYFHVIFALSTLRLPHVRLRLRPKTHLAASRLHPHAMGACLSPPTHPYLVPSGLSALPYAWLEFEEGYTNKIDNIKVSHIRQITA